MKHYLRGIVAAATLACTATFTISAVNANAAAGNETTVKMPRTVTMTKAELLNKIKGGWAGQTIGVTYGGPTEFKYQGVKIGDEVQIPWGDPDYIAKTMTDNPYLYDDIYMDLTFVEVFDRLGIDAPTDSMAHALSLIHI